MFNKLCAKAYATTASYVHSFSADKRGVTAIEYAIIGVAISAIIFAMFNGKLSTALDGAMKTISDNIDSASKIK
ncbi:Flp family type IVb pilin [Vibrio palustris]|uniref:Flp/Fap pilin component n=1 Tax=Vibrio palustris TaxID=1918946 RepID=A0A1R4B1N0_9VIBR|nr:Flp family type IVb pilin [Vibrio palustris]SJL82787.1 Flp/Fap pilin component [Vibrio palustris]